MGKTNEQNLTSTENKELEVHVQNLVAQLKT